MDIPDLYGPEKDVRINASGFRNDFETPPRAPPGIQRIVCSGDSFTFGQGVSNSETWCHLLGERSEGTRSINLGQPGYGVGQAYLRYRRDTEDLDHAIHVFAFILADLERATRPVQHGYARPMFAVVDGELELRNVPVPHFTATMKRQIASLARELRTVDLAQRLLRRVVRPRWPTDEETIEAFGPVASRVFQEVDQDTRSRGARPLFVLLPTELELDPRPAYERWVRHTADSLGLAYLDLATAIREMPREVAQTFFIPEGPAQATDHYTPAGNRWVATEVAQWLSDTGWLSPDSLPPPP